MKRKLLVLSFFFGCLFIVAGCSPNVDNLVSEQYPLRDVVSSSTNASDVARVYVAEGKSIEEIANELQNQRTPKEISQKQNDKQVLVYEDHFVTLTRDENQPGDTLIEVASYGFVRDNYHPDFFDGLMTYWLISNLLGVNDWDRHQRQRCYDTRDPYGNCYGGYNRSGGGYKGPQTPSPFKGTPTRGGGPGTGK
jgi:hypothetical protein